MTVAAPVLTLWTPPGGPPGHWQRTAMPDARRYRFDGRQLAASDRGSALAIEPGLAAMLANRADGITLCAQAGRQLWRLRALASPDAQPLWLAQPLTDSRARILLRIRASLGARLSAQLLHELRNPMNALSLHTDLLSRLIASPDTLARAAGSLQIVRERLNDLSARQNAMVGLWLAPVTDENRSANLQELIEKALRMIRSHFSLHEIRGRAVGLERLATAPAVRLDTRLEIVLIGLLLLACDNLVAQRGGNAADEVVIEATAPTGAGGLPSLCLRAPMPPGRQASGFDWQYRDASVAEVLDEFALLLDGSGLRLRPNGDSEVRLEFSPRLVSPQSL
jgi:signal transduction histidine kinase